jgi:hypothetical protein
MSNEDCSAGCGECRRRGREITEEKLKVEWGGEPSQYDLKK